MEKDFSRLLALAPLFGSEDKAAENFSDILFFSSFTLLNLKVKSSPDFGSLSSQSPNFGIGCHNITEFNLHN